MKFGIFLFSMLLSLNVLGQKTIYVNSVLNSVKVGYLANNKQLELGVKNVLEEALQDKGYELVADKWDAVYLIDVEIVYFDYEQTKMNVGISHKDENAVVIRMKGILYKDGKKEKEIIVEESSSEISMSTLIVDEGGQFNQTSLSNSLKKACDKLVTKILQ